jgi:hypothetical protein
MPKLSRFPPSLSTRRTLKGKTVSFRISTLLILCLLLAASPLLASITADAWTIRLQPAFSIGATPTWASLYTNAPSLEEGSDAVDIPLPPLASQDAIGCYAATIVFDDNGDGGPVVEWVPNVGGERMLLSAGLGDQGVALGANARTILLSESLALDGGTLRVSYAGRMNRLRSVTVRPARELSVAALGTATTPALITEQGKVLSEQEVSGSTPSPRSGDLTDGRVVSAELSAPPLRLDAPESGNSMEFAIPVAGNPAGGVLSAEIAGLDPESWVEITLNGVSRGVLGMAHIDLNDPSTLLSPQGRVTVAGWQQSSLYLPARLWKEGDNSLVLTLHRSQSDAGKPAYLQNARCDLIFQEAQPTQSMPPSAAPSLSPSSHPLNQPAGTLSNGSIYGNPSPTLFRAGLPAPGGA